MPSRTDMAGHTKAFIYSVMDQWGQGQSAPAQGRFEPLTCWSAVEHETHQTITALLVYWGLTPHQQPGSYGDGDDDDDEMSVSLVEETRGPSY